MVTLKERRQCIKVLWEGRVQKVKTLQKTTGFPRKTLYRWVKQLEQTKDLKQGSRPDRSTRLTPP